MALSGIQLSAGIVVGVNKPVDGKYGPYPDVATAKADIGVTLRYLGLTVGIETGGVVEEYWWESGTADGDLVAKGGGGGGGTWGSITGTLSDQTDLQSALDGKQATITGAATTIDTEDLTASRALVSDASGKVAVSDVTATELGYLDGVTSAVQTQVDSKISTYDGTTYDVTALAAVTQAEYDALTPDADTIYFII
jgi:hypothetical protein